MSGHIRRRGEKTWELKFDIGTDPLTGKRLTRYASFKGTKREAEAELTRLLNQRNEGSYVEPSKMTVAEYLRHWLTVYADRQLANRTAKRHRGIIEHNVIPRIGGVPLQKLTSLHIEKLEADLQHEGRIKGKRGGGLAAQTILHVHRTLSQALTHAVSHGAIFRNPARQIRAPKVPGHEIKILDKDELGTLIRAARQSELYTPVLLGATTGLRRGELLGLRWGDLDLKTGLLTVNQSMERVQKKTVFKAPKTKSSRRTITLPGVAVDALQAHRKGQLEARLKLGLGRDPLDLVFTRADGEPIDADSMTKAFGKLIARSKVKRITLHGLRHTHISHLLMDGVHVKVVSERAGHANINITLGTYAAYIPNMQADAAQRVDAALREALKD